MGESFITYIDHNMPTSGSQSPKRNLSSRGDNAKIEKDLLVAPKSPSKERVKGGPETGALVEAPGPHRYDKSLI